MVEGIARLRQRLRAVPDRVRAEVVDEIERQADRIVKEMRQLSPLAEIEIGWTWGDVPRGAITVVRVGKSRTDRVAVKIWARGDGFDARWFEFGTSERVQTTTGRATGAVTAQPFFFPAYRANRRQARAAISRAVARAMKKA